MGRGEGHGDGQPALRAGHGVDRGAVRRHDGLHDGQAEPEAAVAAAFGAVDPLERLEQPLQVGLGDDGAGVGHRQHGLPGALLDDDVHHAVRDVVAQRVVDEVDHEAFDKIGLARRAGRRQPRAQPDAADVGVGPPGRHHLPHHLGQVERLADVQPGLAAGEGEQRVDQPFLLLAGDEHPLVRGAQGLDRGVGVRQRDLDDDPLPGQRGAQLVRGVGDEPALRLERRLQPGQQVVDGVAELLELVDRALQGEPFVQVVRRDLAGGRGDGADPAQHPAGDDPPEQDGDEGHDAQRDAGLNEQFAHLVGALLLGLRLQQAGLLQHLLLGEAPGADHQVAGLGVEVLALDPGAGAARRGVGVPVGGGSADQNVRDAEQQRPGEQEQHPVQQRQP